MKLIIIFLFFLLFSNYALSRNIGETEITTEEGIEVFQKEKYYLLKKNVKIESDTFILFGDLVKIFFEKDLYDVQVIDAVGNVRLDSPQYQLQAEGENLIFTVIKEQIYIKGQSSKLITNDTEMFSDGEIIVNNLSGEFLISGENSSLSAQDIYIEGEYIDGIFENNSETETKDIVLLNVKDKEISYVKTENTDMYANIVKYDKSTSLIELEDNVKIIRDGETITGDYGTLDTETNSYKVKSKNSKKVKVIISNSNE